MARAYNAVADEYARRISPELEGKPFDRAILDRYATRVATRGTVWDLGCGPGHVTRYLHDRSVSVGGLDLSSALIGWARRMNPDIPFHQADFRQLAAADGAWVGIVAFYSILHLAPSEVVPVLTEWRRVLQPGGALLLAAHLGTEDRRVKDWWGHEVDIIFRFFRRGELEGALEEAGFIIDEVHERESYPGTEAQTRRVYLLATTQSPKP